MTIQAFWKPLPYRIFKYYLMLRIMVGELPKIMCMILVFLLSFNDDFMLSFVVLFHLLVLTCGIRVDHVKEKLNAFVWLFSIVFFA